MRCKVGYWRTKELAIQVDQELYDWVKSMRGGLGAQLLPDRRIALLPIYRGAVMRKFYGPSDQTHKAQGFFAEATVAGPFFEMFAPAGALSVELPWFELHELSFCYCHKLDTLVSEPLGPDHELPWPSARHRGHRLSLEDFKHQCFLRIKSALQSGQMGTLDETRVPAAEARMMGAAYAEALTQARIALGLDSPGPVGTSAPRYSAGAVAPEMRSTMKDIDHACRQHGMAYATFGRLSTGDPSLVHTVKQGRVLRPETADRVRAFIQSLNDKAVVA